MRTDVAGEAKIEQSAMAFSRGLKTLEEHEALVGDVLAGRGPRSTTRVGTPALWPPPARATAPDDSFGGVL